MISFLPLSSLAKKPKMYHLYSEPLLGSKHKRRMYSSPIPFKKSFKELSEKQQNIERARYGKFLTDGQNPPFPKYGMIKLVKPVLDKQKEIFADGYLAVAVIIDETGAAQEIISLKTPHKEMEKFIRKFLFELKFDPATCQGKPCEMPFFFSIIIDVTKM